MKTLRIIPVGWPCKLKEAPPGFFVYNEHLAFKSEYGWDNVYCSSGEYFRPTDYLNVMVQPVEYEWIDIPVI